MNFLRDVFYSPIFSFFIIFSYLNSHAYVFKAQQGPFNLRKCYFLNQKGCFTSYFHCSTTNKQSGYDYRWPSLFAEFLSAVLVISDPRKFTKPFSLAYSRIFDGIATKIRLQLVFSSHTVFPRYSLYFNGTHYDCRLNFQNNKPKCFEKFIEV